MTGPPDPDRREDPNRRGGGGGRNRWLLFIAGALAFTALVVFLFGRYPDALTSRGDKVSLTYLVLLLALVASGALAGRRLGFRVALRNIAIWSVIGLTLILGYSYRAELGMLKMRFLGAVLTSRPIVTGDAISVRAASDGHFYMELTVDGTPIRFLVDTGSSDIVLSPADARRVGFDPARLSYTRRYGTANGIVRGAPVRLDSLVLGPVRFRNLPASVNQAAMASSLLGMSFLDRFRSYTVRDGVLTLYR